MVAATEEARGFGWEMMGHALGTGGVGLVYVDALDGASERWCWWFTFFCGGAVGGLATDGVVEDEDLGGACAAVMLVVDG